ncbi:MAG: FAD-dependent oxidoreductase [Sulfuritalea sp.]|nr:FAD-dependent oxidoreductase [Sulfuritalea sp.]MDP1981982.1 FAD-dependent oxidoreductase [Sulfuritalea sp.]
MNRAAVHVGIVGAGPSGCYVADALGRKLPGARIDIFDRLPTPFGLVRGGVAPDHQGTKNIARQFERALGKEGVRFLGNIAVGRDLSYDELKAAYDVLVIATGALEDRRLGIPGEELDAVYGSGQFVAWYNGIPGGRELAPKLDGKSVAIIGNGNVALDIARLLAKTADELATSDICAHARASFAAARIEDIWLIGRRGPVEASFTTAELAEFGELSRVAIRVDAAQLPAALPAELGEERKNLAEKNLEVLRGYARRGTQDERPLRIHFAFNARPLAIEGKDRAERLVLERTRVEHGRAVPGGDSFAIPADTVITAIGYRSTPFPGLPFDPARGVVANAQGRVEAGVYTAGWCKRGPQGVIPANRADSLAVAELILADLAAGAPGAPGGKPGGALIDELLATRNAQPVDFAGWQKINAVEVAAGHGRPREKLASTEELLAAARA